MTNGGIRRRVASAATALLVTATTATVFNVVGATAASASVDNVCRRNTNGTSATPWGIVGSPYPVTLHGTKVYLKTDKINASVRATADSVAAGDILSIDRSNFAVSGTAGHYFKTTSWIMSQSPNSGYSYCEWTATGAGSFSTTISAPKGPIDGAHRYIRVCLRHAGVLQCAGDNGSAAWYGDNDDNWND